MTASSPSKTGTPQVHIHLDVVGGIAGDMFIAAVLDARPDLVPGTVAAIRAAGLPDDWAVDTEPAIDSGLTGTRMRIDPPPDAVPTDGSHYEYRAITASLLNAPLDPSVLERALEILGLIVEAEGTIHGVPVEQVVLHEVGALDSIADVVGAAFLIEQLSPATWSMSPLPVGGGSIQTDHGRLPVPVPATDLLLRGFPFLDDGVGGERITPTGAAILRYLDPSEGLPEGVFRSTETGHGFGTRSLPGVANVLRLRRYLARPATTTTDDQVVVIEFVVDDQTPEDLAVGLDVLRGRSGVLEVLQTAVATKKGRIGHGILVLAAPESLESTAQACFEQTTTIGLRYRYEKRRVLPRRELSGLSDVSVKIVERPGGGTTAKAAMGDVQREAHGYRDRQLLRHDVESAAVGEDGHERP